MVDLVKIRRKAKQKKAEGSGGEKGAGAGAAKVETPSEESKPARNKRGRKSSAASAAKAPKRRVERDPAAEPEVFLEPEIAGPVEPDVAEAPPPRNVQTGDLPASRKKEPKPEPENPEPVAGEVPERLEAFRREAGTRPDAGEPGAVEAVDDDGAGENELLTFVIAGEHYAVAIERIVEIIRPRAATRVPNAADSIVGIISLRGMIVTLLDLRKILGHPGVGSLGEDARVVVVDRDGETAGFIVDRVSRVIKVDPSKIEGHPVVSSNEHSEFVRGVFRHGNDLMILLDLEKVLA